MKPEDYRKKLVRIGVDLVVELIDSKFTTEEIHQILMHASDYAIEYEEEHKDE